MKSQRQISVVTWMTGALSLLSGCIERGQEGSVDGLTDLAEFASELIRSIFATLLL